MSLLSKIKSAVSILGWTAMARFIAPTVVLDLSSASLRCQVRVSRGRVADGPVKSLVVYCRRELYIDM